MSMKAADGPLFRPVGWDGLLVEVADLEAAESVYRLVRRLIADPAVPLEPPRDVVPGARTVLLDTVADVDGWRHAIREAAAGAGADQKAAPAGDAAEVTVLAARYQGPDLDVVAARWNCPPAEVVRRHAAATYRVAFCGFAPGFAYCTSDPPAPPVPRREQPRTSVPAGSVALAGRFCGIYPRAMPGGWQVIATTDAVLFDPDRAEPALLNPGDRVRFEPAT